MVAKSYQNLEIVGDVYTSNGRKYVKVRDAKGNLKQVRWYSDAEYAKYYGEPVVSTPTKSQREVLGFGDEGYITIFGAIGMDEEYEPLKYSPARYCRHWGWYFPSTESLPEDLPAECVPIRLNWEQVGNDNGWLKPENELRDAVDPLIYPASPSEYQGKIGERIERNVLVVRNYKFESNYGISKIMTFEDDQGNVYVWTTTAKDWSEGTRHYIRGTVKSHSRFKNTKQTVLNRVMEVK